MEFFKKINKNIFVFLGGAVVILWQMLGPGYILTLDMVFVPRMKLIFSDTSFYNTLPLHYLLKFFDLFFDGWIIQKILFIVLFFCIGYLAFKFLPVPKNYYVPYWASLFYTVNPFIYERFLAGHWHFLFAYALLPPFIFFLFKFVQKLKWQNMAWLLASIILIGVFSLHLLTMAILILVSYLTYQIIKNLIAKKKDQVKKLLQFSFILCLGLLILSSYWLIPYLFNKKSSILNVFTSENIQLFKTASDSRLNTEINVLALYGFWQEDQPWAHYWLWPKDNFTFWVIVASLLFVIIIIGLIYGLRHKKYRKQAGYFLILGLITLIFSIGLAETIFKNLNQWLFDNLFFWRGFRDTNKFSAFLVLSYAYLGGLGVYAIIKKIKDKKILSHIVLLLLFLVPLFYTYPMLGGFARQLQPVWYPASWHQVNQILNKDNNNFKVLFLPWHQYFSLGFNNSLLTANPANIFFTKEIISSENMELGQISDKKSPVKYQEIEDLISNESQFKETEIMQILQKENINYIILAKDMIGNDVFNYKFLESDF